MNYDNHIFLSATQHRTETEFSDYIDEPENMKYVQTAFSTTDIGPLKSKLNKRSHSEEEIGGSLRRYNRKELKEEILEWIDVYNDKLKVKLLREKMQRLAQKLKKPGEEERLRMKIDKCLKSVPNQLDCDEDRTEIRRELPNNLMRAVRKMYSKSEENSLNTIESMTFYSNVKRAVMDWLVTIPIKRQDFLSKTFKRDDIFNQLTSKLKSVIFNRPDSDIEYKNKLTSSIANVIESLPIDDCNKNSKLANDLTNDILNIGTIFPNRHVQPNIRELKQFIFDEITYFVQKSHIAMNRKTLKYLEAELIDAFIGINDNDDIITKDVCNIFRDIGKIPLYKSRYMTDIILNDYKNYFYGNDINSEEITSRVYSVYHNATNINNDKSCVNQLIDEIYDWFHDLPKDLCIIKDNLNKQCINDLAEKISSGLSIGNMDIIDNEVNIWTENVFKGTLNRNIVKRLKDRLRNVLYEEIKEERDSKHEKLVIRRYEDIIDEWIDETFKEMRSDSSFFNIRNEHVHDLAIKLYNLDLKLYKSNEVITRKLQDEILMWIKTLPFNKQNITVKSAAKLVENIQASEGKDMTEIDSVAKVDFHQLQETVLGWLKKLPLYRNNSTKCKEIMELIMTKLADKLYNSIKDSNLDPHVEIIEYVRMLDTNQNDEFVQNTALNLKQYLQRLNFFEKVLLRNNPEDEFLVANINIWLKYLPLDPKLVKNVESRKIEFVEIIKSLRYWGANDDVLKEEIIAFLMSLPLTHKGEEFLTEEATKLIQSINITKTKKKCTDKSNEIIVGVLKGWCKKLPLISGHNPRELQYLIDNIKTQIIKIQINPEHSFNDGIFRREIFKSLMKFPLKPEYNSDAISEMANDLIEMLKDNIHKLKNNVAVYGVSLHDGPVTDKDVSIRSIKHDDIKSNIEDYAKQLVCHIHEWLSNLNVPNIKEQGFKDVVINDLAGDIIDRHKYLELNPRSVGTNEEELEHLKYQIFKWINKLVGEDNLVTIEHASDLLNRIQSVPVPMLVKPKEKTLQNPTESMLSRSLKLPPECTVTNTEQSQFESTIQEPEVASKRSGICNGQLRKSIRLSSEGDLRLASAPKSDSKSSQNAILRQAASNPGESNTKSINTAAENQATTLPKIYDKYQKIFIEKSNEIVNAAIPNNKSLSDMAKSEVYKGILNSFFSLKSNPDVENDYASFEFMLEDKVDELIDLLPHTTELDNIKHSWKISVLINAVDMLKEIHRVTERPIFRQQLTNRLNRKALKDLEDKECFGLQQGFLVEMANDYILETKYKQDDPIKTNIYRQRLLKKLDDFANNITKEHKLGFKYINRVALKHLAMKVLDEVPIPANDILQEEVEEILLADEIQQWYNELPTYPYLNDMDVLLRKRLIDILAKKLNEIDKNLPRNDPSKERLMKHEMTVFLERKGKLQRDQDLNINFMVNELNNRLKNRWIDKSAEYEAFDGDKPASSTFGRFKNDEILEPVQTVRGSDAAYIQSIGMPNNYTPHVYIDGDNFENSQSRTERPRNMTQEFQNPVNSQIRSPKGSYYSNQEAKTGTSHDPVNSGYRRPQHGGDRNFYMEHNLSKAGYTATMRTEMPLDGEDGRGRVRCRCSRRRSYVCYDCDDNYRRFVPCRYYF